MSSGLYGDNRERTEERFNLERAILNFEVGSVAFGLEGWDGAAPRLELVQAQFNYLHRPDITQASALSDLGLDNACNAHANYQATTRKLRSFSLMMWPAL